MKEIFEEVLVDKIRDLDKIIIANIRDLIEESISDIRVDDVYFLYFSINTKAKIFLILI